MSQFVRKHFRQLEALLKAQSELCQPDFPSHDIGLNREFFVREVLRTHLPTHCGITSGFMCDDSQIPTGQIDIILFHPLTFRVNIGASECCISESVFSAIEVKSQLNENHFNTSVSNLATIRQLSRLHLYTSMRGATVSSEAYHFNTVGTVLFGYKGYSAQKCVEVLREILGASWESRPEAVYDLKVPYLLVRNDYLKFDGEGILQTTGSTWIEKLGDQQLNGYRLIQTDCLLVLITMLSKRIQANYHLLPALHNYIGSGSNQDEP